VNIKFEHFSPSSAVQQHNIKVWPPECNLSTLISHFSLYKFLIANIPLLKSYFNLIPLLRFSSGFETFEVVWGEVSPSANPQPREPGLHIYDPRRQDVPVILLDTG
jgi:hypothetical protein